MKNSDYWKRRFTLLEQVQNGQGAAAFAEIEKQYMEVQNQLEGQIARWYQQFGDNNNISLAQARQYLNGADLKDFMRDVRAHIKYGRENGFSGGWMKELEKVSARFRVSKLDALKIQTRQCIEDLFSKQYETISSAMSDVFESGFYHAAFELQKGFGVGCDIAKLDKSELENILAKPWAADGKNFSERIWANKEKLISEIHNEFTRGIITGQDPQKVIGFITKKLSVSKSNAARLVMTEQAYFGSAAQGKCFQELGVEQYEILATLDSHTSDICQGLDGKVFPLKDFQAGVTAPPFHVRCRSTTAPCFEDGFFGKIEGGEKLPNDITYSEWEKKFVKDNLGLTNGRNGVKIEENNIEPSEEKAVEPNSKTYRYCTNRDYTHLLKNHTKSVSKSDREQIANHKKPDGSSGGYVATRNYSNINSNLRGDSFSFQPLDDDDLKTIEALRNAIKANTLGDDYILTRYVNVDYLSSVFGVTDRRGEALIYKGSLGNHRSMEHALNQMKDKIGTVFEEKGFVSTSVLKDKNIMSDKDVRLTISASSGTHCFLPKNKKESECILGENTVFYITDVKESPLDRKLEIFVTILEGKV